MLLLGRLIGAAGLIVAVWAVFNLLFDAGGAVQDKAEGRQVSSSTKRGAKRSLKILLVGVAILAIGIVIAVVAR